MDNNFTIEIKAYSITELARMYGISNKSMNRWLKPYSAIIGKKEGRYYTALQVRIIFNKLGLPGKVTDAPSKENGWMFVILFLLNLQLFDLIENFQF